MISVHAGGLVNKEAVLLVLGQSLPAPGEGKRERKGEREREREREKDHPNNQEAQERFSVLQTAIQEFD